MPHLFPSVEKVAYDRLLRHRRTPLYQRLGGHRSRPHAAVWFGSPKFRCHACCHFVVGKASFLSFCRRVSAPPKRARTR